MVQLGMLMKLLASQQVLLQLLLAPAAARPALLLFPADDPGFPPAGLASWATWEKRPTPRKRLQGWWMLRLMLSSMWETTHVRRPGLLVCREQCQEAPSLVYGLLWQALLGSCTPFALLLICEHSTSPSNAGSPLRCQRP